MMSSRQSQGRMIVSTRLLGGSNLDRDTADTESGDASDPSGTGIAARKTASSILSMASKRMGRQPVEDDNRISTTSSSSVPPLVQDLLQRTVERAYSTTTTIVNEAASREDMAKDEGMVETESTTTTAPSDEDIDNMPTFEFPFATRYKHHPALTNVALAHALWASILRPNVDTVIDATCGNGHDSVKIAELLFRRPPTSDSDNTDHPCYSHLYCVDIQQQACDNTQQRLTSYLSDDTHNTLSEYIDRVHVVQASHEILPRPVNITSVGLVVYNLGWLPAATIGSDNSGKDCVTTLETTLASMADAALLLRVGGMISVVTYPATGPEEDVAVRLFLECLALLSSNTRTWQEAVSLFEKTSSDQQSSLASEIVHHVAKAMERILHHEGLENNNQTWRVSKHEKLGMDQAPILLTATRIK